MPDGNEEGKVERSEISFIEVFQPESPSDFHSPKA